VYEYSHNSRLKPGKISGFVDIGTLLFVWIRERKRERKKGTETVTEGERERKRKRDKE